MAKTIHESIDLLQQALAEYIEATYHISDPKLVAQRKELLAEIGTIFQSPYLESTPRYAPGPRYREISGLDTEAIRLFEALSTDTPGIGRRIYDPPYTHQAEAIEEAGVKGKNLVIMTGTGSGKTESFLLPILAKLANEAANRPLSFNTPAVRALLLYPMNALVNDQLGRLRGLFDDPRVRELFTNWAGRVPRFARYTSRTPYAGVRDKKKDGRRLKSLRDFYVDIEKACEGDDIAERDAARRVKQELVGRGKWPAKPDLDAWYGDGEWIDRKTQDYGRAITLPDDVELITRHEVQKAPADLLVTNYSMLEYMLMRPIERPIFNATAAWLEKNKSERFLVVLDEAHLYRGSSGAEVGLLLRRLRDRLSLTEDRFQVICSTASFEDPQYALDFGAQLSGTPRSQFALAVQGTYKLRDGEADGTAADANALASVDLDNFYEGADDTAQRIAVAPFLAHKGKGSDGPLEKSLHEALQDFGPLAKLVNITMGKAQPVSSLGAMLFPKADAKVADVASTALLALASRAKPESSSPSLLPARVHTFFRGLSGLWVCMDPNCTVLPEHHRNSICGKMYAQPVERCGCNSRVFEFFTCRNCGGAYARAYTDNVGDPSNLWSKPGQSVRLATGVTGDVTALDLLLEEPKIAAERASFDLDTGRLNAKLSERERTVYLRKDRLMPAVEEDGDEVAPDESLGQFMPCGLCGQSMGRGAFKRSSVQDHQTKGDQPFQALVSRQIQIQPPGPVIDPRFAPLRGRKVLVFSDSRQVAARLAPNLQMYSVRDALRPLLIHGLELLQGNSQIARRLNLDDTYLAAVVAAKHLNVRLRPAMRDDETFGLDAVVENAVASGVLNDEARFADLHVDYRADKPPESLIEDIYDTINDKFTGFEAIALASVRERPGKTDLLVGALPNIPGLAETPEDKIAVVRAWLRFWQRRGIWFQHSPPEWWGGKVRGGPGKFKKSMTRILPQKEQHKAFEKWLPILKQHLSDGQATPRILARELSLELGGSWVRCPSCTSVHRPMPQTRQCLDCDNGRVVPLDPTRDAVFLARKGYYRHAVDLVHQSPPEPPIALIAAEHTAQLNSPSGEDAFSQGEKNEILFQDIDLNWRAGSRGSTAVDILSSTTTMEVGIDIGALSGVALRNMPPGRANYQQRAGRAGRRGHAVATVVAFGSADSHDEYYFTSPAAMISGPVTDPHLTLDNVDIIKRHVLAFLLQNYHQEKLPDEAPPGKADLFSVLGTVTHFRAGGSLLSRDDFVEWMEENQAHLRKRVDDWMPVEFGGAARVALLSNLVEDAKGSIDGAIGYGLDEEEPPPPPPQGGDDDEEIDPSPDGEDRGERNPQNGLLLERLLYEGVLPRYAFPTDVTTFRVFDHSESSGKFHVMSFAPSQGTPIALSQYAPGKQVWISGKCYTSGAIYSPLKGESDKAYKERKIYFECSNCRYAETNDDLGTRGARKECPACREKETFGEGMPWMRPVGFVHPYDLKEETSPDNVPVTSYATRAKLTMQGQEADWGSINMQLRGLAQRTHLLVSNTGPKGEGYSYCTSCGRIEASAEPVRKVKSNTPHPKPFPANKGEEECSGTYVTNGLVLGTKFITDVALFSMKLREPIRLRPGWYSTEVALRTVSEALSKAACQLLEIEPGEILAEFRPGLSPGGHSGEDVEIFLYDTLPGGGGFAPQLVTRGHDLFSRARDLLASCPNPACDSSCYRCLRSFKNKFEHNLLDRHIAADFLDYILTGKIPAFDAGRIERSTDDLFNDLYRLGDDRVTFERRVEMSVSGRQFMIPILATRQRDGALCAIGLSCGLTPAEPESEALRDLRDMETNIAVLPMEELRVRANLPDATQRTMDFLDL